MCVYKQKIWLIVFFFFSADFGPIIYDSVSVHDCILLLDGNYTAPSMADLAAGGSDASDMVDEHDADHDDGDENEQEEELDELREEWREFFDEWKTELAAWKAEFTVNGPQGLPC